MSMDVGAFEIFEPIPKKREVHAVAMLRPWLDAGNVGTLVLSSLEQHLEAKEVGQLKKPGTFFDFTRYRPQTRNIEGRRILTLPNSKISYAQRENSPDLLLLHLLEPHAFAEEYIESVIEIVKTFEVKRYCRIGAMYNAVPHTRPLRITGTLDGQPLKGISGVTSFGRGSYQGPTSAMNLVSDAIEKLNIESMSLMVHLPQYLELEEDYLGVSRVMAVLGAMYGLPSELSESEQGERQYRELNSEVERNPAVKAMVRRLEAFYDARESSKEEEKQEPLLSPEVQRFLQEMGQQFDNS
ncbi:PAC2 family protein [SAR202 cluster bacterium AD-802-E10_MRT_200m]|nr:PAC2 family protein [SAR202 cluster bacterium AD-802-E10_MRT_200m]